MNEDKEENEVAFLIDYFLQLEDHLPDSLESLREDLFICSGNLTVWLATNHIGGKSIENDLQFARSIPVFTEFMGPAFTAWIELMKIKYQS